jgi:dephospho-CoA kinase
MKIGITGGIGSGKSTVCKIFATLGIPIYYSDDRAKWLMEHNPELVAGIKALFGDEAYLNDGALNRPLIAAAAFNDANKLSQLNALVHPQVFADVHVWQNEHSQYPYTLREAALIFESGVFRQLDKVITVYAPIELRLQRVIARDGTTEEAVKARMARQLSDEEKVRQSHYVIVNDGQQALIPQVMKIHWELLGIKEATAIE